jgi:hypothetical protein
MNIQDFLSPNDVTIDVAPVNKHKLQQTWATFPAK